MNLLTTETFCRYCLYCKSPTQDGASYCCSACEVLDSRVGPLPLLQKNLNPYSYLDKQEFRDLYHQSDADFDYLFFAEGLHCSSCVHLLEKLPEFYPEILAARVDFAPSTVSVKVSPQASLAQVAHTIKELGYQPIILSPQENVSQHHIEENRNFLKRIAVAGFCAGNTMLFVIPVYAGLAGSLATLFNWLSFLLFLPILTYSAIPFYRGAWNSLKYKVINVDLPIVIAMLSGFVLSTYNLLRGNGAIYFDSTASFLFFILGARYLLKRVQQNYLSTSSLKSFFQGEKYLRLQENNEEPIHWSHAKVGDTLKIQTGQTLPSDCELVSSHATLDMSLSNGESLPKVFSQGMILFAGTKVLQNEILVRVQTSFADSKLGKLLKQLDQGALIKSQFVALTDRLAQKLILTVFTVAALFFVIYSQINFDQAFNRALALIVLACPCALAFGSPLTFGLALKKAQRKGLLLKDATSLERILQVKNIFFDKTGTLTEGTLSLSHCEPALISPTIQKIALSLEAPSYHPIAFALRKAWPHPDTLFEVEAAQEILGQGVRGKIAGSWYEIRHLAESTHESEIAIELFKDTHSIARLYFTDAMRTEAARSIKFLHQKGIQCFILSGDKKSRALEAALASGIPKDRVFSELFPEDKKEILLRFKNTCMIGDGANDSLSLQAADVGIAVKGSVDLSLHSADVYFTRGGLAPLFDFIQLAQNTRRVLIRNLAISLLYNSLGGSLALLGFINPMMAAILMPISSIIIILSSLWGLR